VLCFIPAAPQIIGSVGIYLLIMAPFALAFYGSAILKKLARWLVREEESDDDAPEFGDRLRDD
jgi:hypothetical protein